MGVVSRVLSTRPAALGLPAQGRRRLHPPEQWLQHPHLHHSHILSRRRAAFCAVAELQRAGKRVPARSVSDGAVPCRVSRIASGRRPLDSGKGLSPFALQHHARPETGRRLRGFSERGRRCCQQHSDAQGARWRGRPRRAQQEQHQPCPQRQRQRGRCARRREQHQERGAIRAAAPSLLHEQPAARHDAPGDLPVVPREHGQGQGRQQGLAEQHPPQSEHEHGTSSLEGDGVRRGCRSEAGQCS